MIILAIALAVAIGYALYERRQRLFADERWDWWSNQYFYAKNDVNFLENKLFLAEQEILGFNESEFYSFNYCYDVLKYAVADTEELTHGH